MFAKNNTLNRVRVAADFEADSIFVAGSDIMEDHAIITVSNHNHITTFTSPYTRRTSSTFLPWTQHLVDERTLVSWDVAGASLDVTKVSLISFELLNYFHLI